jgi:DNA-binding transcriptional LysR family regulator
VGEESVGDESVDGNSPHGERFTIAFALGVTLTRWTTAWEQRHPSRPLAFVPTTPQNQVSVLLDSQADVSQADVSFVRLPVDPRGLSLIPLYEEQAVVVLPKGHELADLESVTLAQLLGEDIREPSLDALELVAAGGGAVIVPQSIARLAARRDVVARPVSDAAPPSIALAWLADSTTDEIEAFVGIVRGRTVNSSRGSENDAAPMPKKEQSTKTRPARSTVRPATGRSRQRKPRQR